MRSRASYARIGTMLWTGLVLLAGYGLAGCGDDDDDNPMDPGAGTDKSYLSGVYGDGVESGSMIVTIHSAGLAPRLVGSKLSQEVPASAVLRPDEGGGFVSLNGTYDRGSDTLSLSDTVYSFTGVLDESGPGTGMEGIYAGPNGGGLFHCALGWSDVVTIYCGDFEYTSQTSGGEWDMVIADDVVRGIFGGQHYFFSFTGAVTTGLERTISIDEEFAEIRLVADGALNTTGATGSWKILENGAPADSGTWSASGCGVVP